MNSTQLYRAREFAKRVGVTVRTLHHYDRIGLLKPAALNESGHRLYATRELQRLERIVALKFIGLSLREIKQILAQDATDLVTTLRIQRRSIEQMRRRLDDIVLAISHAETSASGDGEQSWEALKRIIGLMEVHGKMEWVRSYYTEEQLENLRSRATPELLANAEQDWKQLIAEVEASLTEDPAGEHAQELASRWTALIQQFTGGDEAILQNLKRLYADRENWSADFQKPFSDEASAFIERAISARQR